ncbi:hypothetical protein G5V57_27075 [Nordella sp. HKS 07]|uniref:hypothetical protein n=1 Tax=Nordella sp. HKS 07 TaxID=2712222 RepID=UPI0013E1713D|nr:hypothetical protein [Nordella sp. HKS 07]QIG51067.1 hypothetical protein G5V57_27075 [Nordella sp. HKS 07]
MSKSLLLEQFAKAHQKAEAAHLETILKSDTVTRLATNGRDSTEAERRLSLAKMADQKHLAEIYWVLNQLEQIGAKADNG